jgi:hypothetical protein
MNDEEIQNIVSRMDERWARIEEDLQKLKHVLLEGNGTPAMIVRVALVEQELKRVNEEREDRKVPRHVSVGLYVSIILAVGSILAGFVH